MLRVILNFAQALIFYLSVSFSKLKGFWRPLTKQHKKVKSTKLALKEGESYRLGECIVTLAKFGIEGKKEVEAKLAAFELERQAREERYKQRGIEIMLMNPDELTQFQVNEWMKNRKAFNEKKYYDNLSDTYQQEKK